MITADLEIKGITEEVAFPAQVAIKDGILAAIGEIKVNRTKYNVRYGSASFFDGLGDRAIDDEFTIHVSIGAKK